MPMGGGGGGGRGNANPGMIHATMQVQSYFFPEGLPADRPLVAPALKKDLPTSSTMTRKEMATPPANREQARDGNSKKTGGVGK
jgi:hypothetical protein